MSPIPLGILAVSGAAAAGAYELIATQVLTSNAASVTFSAIPQDYKHLQLRITARTTRSDQRENVFMRLNGDTGNNYGYHILEGNGSSVSSFGAASQASMLPADIEAASATANAFSPVIIDVLDYTSAAKNTTIRSLMGRTGGTRAIWLNSGLWVNTSSVTTILLLAQVTSFVTASRFSLYGIRG